MSDLELAKKVINQADAILISAGAGIGVDSGLPDFRGNEGFWKAYPPIAKLGLSFSEIANPKWFAEKPRMAWAFYGHRLNLYRQTVPHAGFQHLLELCKKKKLGYFVFTSNVDGQFQKAGFHPEQIEECHGSIHHFQCTKPCCKNIWDANEIIININFETFEALGELPKCPQCGALARPNILMFSDMRWIEQRSEDQARRLSNWLQTLSLNSAKLAIIEIGAGESIPTVRFTSEKIARKLNGKLIRINPRDFEVPEGNISIAKNALEGIELLLGR